MLPAPYSEQEIRRFLMLTRSVANGAIVYAGAPDAGWYAECWMPAPYSALSVANYFLSKEPMTVMRLQKLVFYAHGIYLAERGKPLIFDHIQAWKWGPVIPVLYQAFKHFKDREITEQATVVMPSGGTSMVVMPVAPPEASDAVAILEDTWRLLGRFSAAKLSNATHQPGTPWHEVYQRSMDEHGKLVPNLRIENERIEAFFRQLLRKNGDVAV
jgi:Uncharacterized phage-associated protein